MIAALLLSITLLAPAVLGDASPKAKATPIVTTDMLYSTGELIYDIYETTYSHLANSKYGQQATEAITKGKTVVSDALAKSVPADPLGELCGKVGMKKALILEKWTAAQDIVLHAKSLLAEKSAMAYEPMNLMAAKVVDMFESFMPKYKSMIPKTLGDFLLIMVYFALVFYVLLKATLFAVRIALRVFFGIFCFIFCCGCCRRGTSSEGSSKKKSKAVEKGKVAVSPDAKAAGAKKKGKA